MLKAIIIDDEQHCIDRPKMLLAAHGERVYLMNAFQTVADGLKGIAMLKPNLVFLDVQIGDETGFDLLKAIPAPEFEVVFTTAFDRYAVQAFKVSAADYLLKPVDADDLAAALKKLDEAKPANTVKEKLNVLFDNLNGREKRITVPAANELLFIPVADIIHCRSDINYTTIYLKDKQKIVVAKTLKEFEEMLADYNFFRIHNSHLVNLTCVASYTKGKGGSVHLTDGTELKVSTRRKEDLLARLTQT